MNGCRDEGFLSVDGKEIYYLCIIDILQLYDLNKKAERFWKVRVMHKDFVRRRPALPAPNWGSALILIRCTRACRAVGRVVCVSCVVCRVCRVVSCGVVCSMEYRCSRHHDIGIGSWRARSIWSPRPTPRPPELAAARVGLIFWLCIFPRICFFKEKEIIFYACRDDDRHQ